MGDEAIAEEEDVEAADEAALAEIEDDDDDEIKAADVDEDEIDAELAEELGEEPVAAEDEEVCPWRHALSLMLLSLQQRRPAAQGHRACMWESSSLNKGAQHSHYAISLQSSCMVLR